MNSSKRYQLRQAAGMYWLLDMEQSGKDYKKPIVMNESGAFIWQQYEKTGNKEAVATVLQEQYGVPAEEAAQDIEEFFQQLQKQGLY